METITKKLEDAFVSEMEKFEKSPIKTGLKWLVILFIMKKVFKWVTCK